MSSTMAPEELEAELKEIRVLSHEEMACLWRFAPAGHKYFDRQLPLFTAFEARFKALGGMTPEISKSIGL